MLFDHKKDLFANATPTQRQSLCDVIHTEVPDLLVFEISGAFIDSIDDLPVYGPDAVIFGWSKHQLYLRAQADTDGEPSSASDGVVTMSVRPSGVTIKHHGAPQVIDQWSRGRRSLVNQIEFRPNGDFDPGALLPIATLLIDD